MALCCGPGSMWMTGLGLSDRENVIWSHVAAACAALDKLLDLEPDIDVHHAIQRIRSHLEARACQTASPAILPVAKTNLGSPGYDGLAPVVPRLITNDWLE